MSIFPGVGLAAIVSGAREITDDMCGIAATGLARLVPPDRVAQGALYPPIAGLRQLNVISACENYIHAIRMPANVPRPQHGPRPVRTGRPIPLVALAASHG